MFMTRMLRFSTPQMAELLKQYASFLPTRTTLQQFVAFGKHVSEEKEIQSCQFLHKELPVRIAHLAHDIEMLPEGLRTAPSVQRVKNWHLLSFQDLVEFPSDLPPAEYCEKFTKILENIYDRHAPVVVTMARGVLEMKKALGHVEPGGGVDLATQACLDRFYMSRIGIRMLIGQHVELFGSKKQENKARSTQVGIIDQYCRLSDIAMEAAGNARFLCHNKYLCAPEVEIITPQVSNPQDITFPYVPYHLYHILFELLKNSVRAVTEFHTPDCPNLPPVQVLIVKGKEEDISIKISDKGGGIPRSGLPLLYTYMYSTADSPLLDENETPDARQAPLAGFGYGLPLSRLFARYFGGDLQVVSMEGYGTDAFIFLKRAADAAGEVLPQFDSYSTLERGMKASYRALNYAVGC